MGGVCRIIQEKVIEMNKEKMVLWVVIGVVVVVLSVLFTLTPSFIGTSESPAIPAPATK